MHLQPVQVQPLPLQDLGFEEFEVVPSQQDRALQPAPLQPAPLQPAPLQHEQQRPWDPWQEDGPDSSQQNEALHAPLQQVQELQHAPLQLQQQQLQRGPDPWQLGPDPWQRQQGPNPLQQVQALQQAPLQQVQALQQPPLQQVQALQQPPLQQVQALLQLPLQQNQALQPPLQQHAAPLQQHAAPLQQHAAPLQRAAPLQHAEPLQQNQVMYGLQPDPWQQRPDPWQQQRPDAWQHRPDPGLRQLPVVEEIDESDAIVEKKRYIGQRAYIVDMPDGGKYCRLCERGASADHMVSSKHVRQLGWEWDRSVPIFLKMTFRKSFNWQFHLDGKVKSLDYYASLLVVFPRSPPQVYDWVAIRNCRRSFDLSDFQIHHVVPFEFTVHFRLKGQEPRRRLQ
jgi:hypothetical protein